LVGGTEYPHPAVDEAGAAQELSQLLFAVIHHMTFFEPSVKPVPPPESERKIAARVGYDQLPSRSKDPSKLGESDLGFRKMVKSHGAD